MKRIFRGSFARGWMPDADSVNAPEDALLRADNLILDEEGIVSIRKGSEPIYESRLPGGYVDSLHDCTLLPADDYGSYDEIRRSAAFAGCKNLVYWINARDSDGTETPKSLGVTFTTHSAAETDADDESLNDYSMIDYLDTFFVARGTTKKKWRGETDADDTVLTTEIDEFGQPLYEEWEHGDPQAVHNWGITMTGTAPTLAARGNPDVRQINTCEATTGWDIPTGNGDGLDTDAVNYVEGTKSIKGDAGSNNTLVLEKTEGGVDWTAWLSKFVESCRKTTDDGATYTDYTSEAGDGSASTHVALSSLDTLANGDWLIIGCKNFQFTTIGVDMDATNVNGTTSALAVHYWDGSDWTAVTTLVDGTDSGGATFATDGDITFDLPSDWVENTIDGVTAYHVRLTVNAALDSSTDVDAITVDALDYLDLDTLLDFKARVSDHTKLRSLSVYIDTNDGSFNDDYFYYKFLVGQTVIVAREPDEILNSDQFYDWWYTQHGTEITEDERSFIESRDRLAEKLWKQAVTDMATSGLPVTEWAKFQAEAVEGWNHVSLALGKFRKVGEPTWTNVEAIRFVFDIDEDIQCNLDDIKLIGGGNNPIIGKYRYRYSYVRKVIDAGGDIQYYARSAPSATSAAIQVKGTGVDVTIPADASRDTQTNEIWVYRTGGYLDNFYRVGKIVTDTGSADTAGIGTGALVFFDCKSDVNTLIENQVMEYDIGPPPDDIVDVTGPYYDRLYCLTRNHLYPSQIREPDNFSTREGIRVADVGERAWWVIQGFGGLYVGTNRTIKRLEGTGAPLPDGTTDFALRDLNIRPAPISKAVAQEGNYLVYLADGGWFAFDGVSSRSIMAGNELLYRGYDRHGVSAIELNNPSLRYRAVISKGKFVTLAPEQKRITILDPRGNPRTSIRSIAKNVHWYDFADQVWYRHIYSKGFRSIYLKRNGDLIAGTDDGFVWQLDTGIDDDGTAIPVVLWTKVDANGEPDSKKDPWDYKIKLDSGGDDVTINLHLDGSETSSKTITASSDGMSTYQEAIDDLAACTQIQQRITGDLTTFKLYETNITYRDRPVILDYHENKPESPSPTRRRFGGLSLIIDTFGGDATVTPVLDDTDQTSQTVNATDSQVKKVFIDAIVGRDLWAKVEKSDGFEIYDISPIVIEQFPEQMKGLGPKTNMGSEAEKVSTGVRIKACTLGEEVTFTVYLDGVDSGETFTLTTDEDEPQTEIFNYTTTRTFTDIALHTDGVVEIYEWLPQVLYELPSAVKVWDTGPVHMGRDDLVWIREIKIKCRTPEDLVVTPYFDGAAFPSYTHRCDAYGVDTIYRIPVGREYKGRVPQIQVRTVTNREFRPWYVEFYFRGTGLTSEKRLFRVKAK